MNQLCSSSPKFQTSMRMQEDVIVNQNQTVETQYWKNKSCSFSTRQVHDAVKKNTTLTEVSRKDRESAIVSVTEDQEE